MNLADLIISLGKDGLKSAYSSLQAFALFLTLALALILTVVYIVLRLKKPEHLKSFANIALGVVIGFALTLTACISLFMVGRLNVKGETDINFMLVLGFLGVVLLYAIGALITKFISKKAFTICNYVGIFLMVAYGVVLLFVLPTVGEKYAPLSTSGMYIFSILLVAVIAVLSIIFGKDKGSASTTKSIAYAGVCIALSFALSYIKLFSLPQSGSVTLASALPLIIYSYVFGARKGVFAGVIYGVLQCLQSPQIYQPMQVLLDYPIAFAGIGVAGITKNFKFGTPLVKFIIGASIGLVLRYFAHFLSGYYVFSSWMMEGYTALTWSLVYNLYVIVDLAIVLAVGFFIFNSKGTVNQLELINPEK